MCETFEIYKEQTFHFPASDVWVTGMNVRQQYNDRCQLYAEIMLQDLLDLDKSIFKHLEIKMDLYL